VIGVAYPVLDGCEPWGARLRRWRDETKQWSQQDLVDQVVRLAFETKEERGTRLDTRLVGRWETGAVSRPQPVYRRLLGKLGAPLPDPNVPLVTTAATVVPGECPADPSTPDLTSVIDQYGSEPEDGESPVLRRDFLRAGSAAAVAGLLVTVVGAPTTGRTSRPLIAELRSRLVRLRKLDDTLGGADTYSLYAAEAGVTEQLLRQSTNPEPIHNELLALHAEQSQQAGWAAFDAGWHDAAIEHYRQSQAAAQEAGDAGLAGNALAFQAYQLLALGKPARTVSEQLSTDLEN